MQGYILAVIVSIFFAITPISPQLKGEEIGVHSNVSLHSQVNGGDVPEILSTDETRVVLSRKKRGLHNWGRGRQGGRQPPGRSRGRHTSRRKEETPEAKLRKMTDRLFRRIASFKIPKGYVLPFCFKDTKLNDEIEEMSGTCDRMGVDWSCVFAEMAGGDNGFSIKTLASKFSEVEEKSLQRGLKSAIVACDEYWQQYKHEERRRLLLHELEMEVISRTWVEHGEPIGEPSKPKRRTEDFKNLTNPAAMRMALLDSGMADYSVEPNSSQGNDSHALTAHFFKIRSTRPISTPTSQNNHPNRRYTIHQRRKRLWKANSCLKVPEYWKSLVTQDQLGQEERCRRDEAMLDRIKQERERKRLEVLKKKELREEAQRRIEEIMRQGGGKEGELEALRVTAKDKPEVESKLGQHLEREERIEEDLRSQVSSCITKEATKACEPKVMQALSSLFP